MVTKKALVLTLALGFLSGICGWMAANSGRPVFAEGAVYYRVINENDGEKIERELNEIVRSDSSCRAILTTSQSDYGKSKVILECAGR